MGKLAHFLEKRHKRPLLVAADVYRPAAIDQLRIIGEKLGIPVYSEPGGSPPEICQRAVRIAAESGRDVVIFDTPVVWPSTSRSWRSCPRSTGASTRPISCWWCTR